MSEKQINDQNYQHGYFSSSKFKNYIIQKYFKGLGEDAQMETTNIIRTPPGYDENNNHTFVIEEVAQTRPQLSKWLESAANFTPSKNNYIEWCVINKNEHGLHKDDDFTIESQQISIHQKEEIEAAEALTKLAFNFRNRCTR